MPKSAENVIPYNNFAKPFTKFDPTALPRLSDEHYAAVQEKIKVAWIPRDEPETEIKKRHYPHSFLMPVVYSALRKMKNLGAISSNEFVALVQHNIHQAPADRIAIIRDIQDNYGATGLYLLVVETLEHVLQLDPTCLAVDDFERFQTSGFLPKQTQSVAYFEKATDGLRAQMLREFEQDLARRGLPIETMFDDMDARIKQAGEQLEREKEALLQVNPAASKDISNKERESTGRMPKSTEEKQKDKHPSRQPGYVQPGREGKVIVKAFVEMEERKKLGDLAKGAGLTTEDLLIYLATNAITKAAGDASFRAELAEEGKRVAETRRLAAEAAKRAAAGAKRAVRQTRQRVSKNTLG